LQLRDDVNMDETGFSGVYTKGNKRRSRLYTRALTEKPLFEEELINERGSCFRFFDCRRSKLAAAVAKGLKGDHIKHGSAVLYLGASHGYTVSFVSDIIGENGIIFALDFAPRVVRDLMIKVAAARSNIAPILADASRPEEYYHAVLAADLIYQDVAQKNQLEIFLKNVKLFLKNNGIAMLALKARSIDVRRDPKRVFSETKIRLETELRVINYMRLEPYELDHGFFVCKKP